MEQKKIKGGRTNKRIIARVSITCCHILIFLGSSGFVRGRRPAWPEGKNADRNNSETGHEAGQRKRVPQKKPGLLPGPIFAWSDGHPGSCVSSDDEHGKRQAAVAAAILGADPRAPYQKTSSGTRRILQPRDATLHLCTLDIARVCHLSRRSRVCTPVRLIKASVVQG
ncbi:hypothetical protein B0T26DRAFT_680148 [Lasiosphaeria miniovina]|uniref:Uncharacterized protein n=1 Tax=Lasiosphaeria miniovina TaxID=1954250 RepID=A0AA39ZZD7_9PEZI|nr:uncharacterized protein B0T26DRAFT_680148 [Lasiosphaeria miniovina]KAK0706468.1 hypothetical protein B0T26DRAFT_680148 [Lasiosphaeria miniovina]